MWQLSKKIVNNIQDNLVETKFLSAPIFTFFCYFDKVCVIFASWISERDILLASQCVLQLFIQTTREWIMFTHNAVPFPEEAENL